MDISNNINTSTRIPATRVGNRSGKAVADTELPPSSSTKVSLSDTSHSAAGVRDGLSTQSASAGEPVFDANKVEQIKTAIANGQFQVDPAKVADGLLNTVRSLLAQGAG